MKQETVDTYGKPKVYVTGHSDRFPECYSNIKNDLLTYCDVYYDDDPEHPEDKNQFFNLLESMQLLVLAVTRNFVNDTNCFAFNVFKFAEEKHIPILPILFDKDKGIEEKFNSVCKDKKIQLLYYGDNGIFNNEKSYKDKLKDSLDSFLSVDDEVINKIHKQFVAKVFLSYKRECREQALELMRKIHSKDIFRDVAIWYDGHLVSGSYFEDEIDNAIKNSDLFVISVTEKALDANNNYILKKEYPYAIDLGRPIIPVEMSQTDKTMFNEKYGKEYKEKRCEDLLLISPEDVESKLKQEFEKKGVNLKPNDDPEHLYYIGLAHLKGICVEIDRERAVQLITAAAEKRFPEAIQRLILMYRNGDGVERSYEKAIEWQQSLVKICEENFNRTKSNDDAVRWMQEFDKLSNYYYEIGKIDRALMVYEEEMTALEKVRGSVEEEWYLTSSLVICIHILDIYRIMGEKEVDNAAEQIKKAFEIEETLSRKQNQFNTPFFNVNIYKTLNRFYDRVGDFYKESGDIEDPEVYEKVKEYYGRALKYNEKRRKFICDNMDNIVPDKQYYLMSEVQIDLALSYYKLANLTRNRDFKTALEYYGNSISIAAQYSREPFAQRIVYKSYEDIGEIYQEREEYLAARLFYEKAFDILNEVSKDGDNYIDMLRDRAGLCNKLGHINKEMGNLDMAKDRLTQGIKIAEELKKQISTPEVEKTLADLHNGLVDCLRKQIVQSRATGYMYLENQRFDKVTYKWFYKCLKECQELYNIITDFNSYYNLAIAYVDVSNFYNNEEKLNALKQAELILLKLAEISDNDNVKQLLGQVQQRIKEISDT